MISSFNKCDVCKNYLICSNNFTCSFTNRRYYTREVLNCNFNNVICLIACKNYQEQYVGSATNFKSRFTIHERDIKTNKYRCGTLKHFNGMCKNSNNISQFLSVQIIEQVCSNATEIEEIFLAQRKILAKAVIYH